MTFLLCTFALLVAYRYATGTVFMDWYLFQIARQTSGLLACVGHSSSVENPQNDQGHAAEMRAQLAAWSSRPGPAAQGPLTSWEVWRYRAVKARHDLRAEKKRLHLLTEPAGTPPADPARFEIFLAKRVAVLDEAIERPGATRLVSPADGRARAVVQQAQAALANVGADRALDVAARMVRLKAIDRALRSAIEAQAALERRRVALRSAAMREDGPRVYFVARAGTSRCVAELRQRIDELKKDPAKGGAAGHARLAAAETKIDDLQKQLAHDPASGSDVSFVFRIVADCGGVASMAIYLAAVLAFPTGWRQRLAGLVGLPILYAINIVRLACLGVLGAWLGKGKWFEFVHNYVWQVIYIAFVVVIWLLWVELAVKRRVPETAHPE